MKATIDIPEDLYRRVKAKSAMQALTVREVTVSLYRTWLESSDDAVEEKRTLEHSPPPTWFGGAKRYAERVEKHDMKSIRESITKGRTESGGNS